MGESDNIEDVGYLQDIISYIFDEKKIVTYKWISNVLSIHVNRAKQLLYTFIKHISEERMKELQVTYLVGGILPNDRGCRLQVVSEEDLEKVKAQFKVITSEHIYSVSLKNCLVDLQNLCSVDGVKDSEVGRHGAVKCLKSISRTSQENASKRQGAYKSVEDDKKWPTAQTKPEKETSTGSNEKKSSKISNGISAMFAAQNGKKKAEDTSPKKPDVKSAEKSSPEKKVHAAKSTSKGSKPPGNRLAAMFSAQNAKPKTAKKDVQEENKPETNGENSEKGPKGPENNSKLEEKHEKKNTDSKNTQEKSSKTKTKSESKKSKQKKRKASNNEDKSKKRKRIVIMDDSDSSDDDIFGSDKDNEEEEDKSYLQPPPENEEEEDEEIEKPTEVAASKDSERPEPDANVHHARKRHLVDKTFMDEEGYMVTKKVYEYVSCGESDSEGEKENEKASKSKNNKTESESNDSKSETESKKLKTEKQTSKTVQGPQKSLKNKNQKKNSSPEKKKQATLMNFFKRS